MLSSQNIRGNKRWRHPGKTTGRVLTHSSIVLPAITAPTSYVWDTYANMQVSRTWAVAMVELDWMQPQHWKGNLSDAVTDTLIDRFGNDEGYRDLFSIDLTLDNGHCGELHGGKKFDACITLTQTSTPSPGFLAHVRNYEQWEPGFGSALLWLVSKAEKYTLPFYTPQEALLTCSSLNWHGENDETATRHEMEEEDWKDAEIPTRADFDKMIPRWASEPQRMEPAAMADCADRIMRRRDCPIGFKECFDALMEVEKWEGTERNDKYQAYNEVGACYFLAIQFNEADHSLHYFDEAYNNHMQSGFSMDLAYARVVNSDNSEDVRSALLGLESKLQRLPTITKILKHICALT